MAENLRKVRFCTEFKWTKTGGLPGPAHAGPIHTGVCAISAGAAAFHQKRNRARVLSRRSGILSVYAIAPGSI